MMDLDVNVDSSPNSTTVVCGTKNFRVGSKRRAMASVMKFAAPVSSSAIEAVKLKESAETVILVIGCTVDGDAATLSQALLGWFWYFVGPWLAGLELLLDVGRLLGSLKLTALAW